MDLTRDLLARYAPFARAAGRVLLIIGALGLLLLLVEPAHGVLAAALMALGGVWWLYGLHRQRQPACWVRVDQSGVVFMPEGARHTHAAVGALRVVDASYQTVVLEAERTIEAKAVYAEGLQRRIAFFKTDAEAAAWIARYQQAQSEPPSASTRGATPLARTIAIGVMLASVAAVALAWRMPALTVGVGAGIFALAAAGGAVILEQHRLGQGLAVALGVGLWVRPFIAPVMVMLPEGPYALGLLAEPHLGCVIGGTLALVGGVALARPPRAKESADG